MRRALMWLFNVIRYGLGIAVPLLALYALTLSFPVEGILSVARYLYATLLALFVLWLLNRMGKEILFQGKNPGEMGVTEKIGRERNALVAVIALVAAGLFLTHLSTLPQEASPLWPLPLTDLSGWACLAVLGGFLAAHFVLRRIVPQADPLLLPLAALLCGLGLIFLYRLGPDLAVTHHDPALRRLALRQSLWAGLGLAAMLLCLRLLEDGRLLWISRKKYLWVLLSIVLILLTGIFGKEVNDRRLWLAVGPLNIQTVEIVKVVLVLFVAGYFYDEGSYIRVRRPWGIRVPGQMTFVGPYLLMWFLALLPIFFQKDLGPTILLSCLFLAMFYVGSSLGSTAALGLSSFVLLGFLFYGLGWPSMVRTRIDMWLDPFGRSEHLVHSLWAISSGRLWGAGLGLGQPQQVPVVHSDFIFAAVCEELGFVGGASLLAIYLLLFHRGFKIALDCSHPYKKLLAVGLMTLFAVQSLMIVGGVTGALPLTGITLPFMSYGGSSLVINFILVGLLLRISAS